MNKYRLYLFLQGLTVILVLGLFRSIPERQLAGLIAGIVFLSVSAGICIYEFRFGQSFRSLTFWGTLSFLLFSGLPLFFLRIVNWGVPFEMIQWGPFSGPQLHTISNVIFLIMLLAIFVDSLKARFQKESEK